MAGVEDGIVFDLVGIEMRVPPSQGLHGAEYSCTPVGTPYTEPAIGPSPEAARDASRPATESGEIVPPSPAFGDALSR